MDTAQSEIGTISRVVVKHARDAFRSPQTIEEEWRALNFTSAPDFDDAVRQYDRFAELLSVCGAALYLWMNGDPVWLLPLFFAADLSMLGYLAGPRPGATSGPTPSRSATSSGCAARRGSAAGSSWRCASSTRCTASSGAIAPTVPRG